MFINLPREITICQVTLFNDSLGEGAIKNVDVSRHPEHENQPIREEVRIKTPPRSEFP